jgi:hypothetical protein
MLRTILALGAVGSSRFLGGCGVTCRPADERALTLASLQPDDVR